MHKGCAVYRRPGFPPECHIWSCRWLLQEPGTENLHRPDRAHYCLDVLPDYVTLVDPKSDEPIAVEVVQVWCDPGYPDAHRDPALRAWLDAKRMPALVRYDERKALHLFPPSCSDDHRWHEITDTTSPERQHSPAQIAAAVGVRPVATTGGEPQ
jgi:hypothetical protein